MNLTPSELKLAERLKERERMWLRMRWGALLLGLGAAAIGLFFFHALWKELEQEELLLQLLAVAEPICCFFVLGGSVAVGYALIFWKGRREKKLLLRLLEAEIKRAAAVVQ